MIQNQFYNEVSWIKFVGELLIKFIIARRSTFLLAALLALASTTQANPIQGKHLKIVTLPVSPCSAKQKH